MKKGRVKDMVAVITPVEAGLGEQKLVNVRKQLDMPIQRKLKWEGCKMGKVTGTWMRVFLGCKGAEGSYDCRESQQGSKSTGADIFPVRVNSKRKAELTGIKVQLT